MTYNNEYDTKFFKAIVIFSILACLVFVFLTGCSSFEAKVTDDMTPECKDFYYVMEYYSNQKIDSAFVGTVYNECKNSRQDAKQKKIEELCGQIYTDKNEYAKCLK